MAFQPCNARCFSNFELQGGRVKRQWSLLPNPGAVDYTVSNISPSGGTAGVETALSSTFLERPEKGSLSAFRAWRDNFKALRPKLFKTEIAWRIDCARKEIRGA
jgi:hypothetical protein